MYFLNFLDIFSKHISLIYFLYVFLLLPPTATTNHPTIDFLDRCLADYKHVSIRPKFPISSPKISWQCCSGFARYVWYQICDTVKVIPDMWSMRRLEQNRVVSQPLASWLGDTRYHGCAIQETDMQPDTNHTLADTIPHQTPAYM